MERQFQRLFKNQTPENVERVGEIQEIQEKLRRVRKGSDVYSASFPDPVNVGDIGRCRKGFEVRQILNNSEALVKYAGDLYLMRGIDFSNFVDDSVLTYNDLLHISGTYRYTTVKGGTNTICVLEPLPQSVRAEVAKGFDKYVDAAQAKAKAIAELEPGKWRSGRLTIEAKFMAFNNGVVILKRTDTGVIINAPINRLSRADQEYVQKVTQEPEDAEEGGGSGE